MNRVWQADFYRRPLKDEKGQVLWELLLCDATRSFRYDAFCPQSEANASWLVSQLQKAAGGNLPNLIQVFRPQSLSLIQAGAQQLGIQVEATRRTRALKEYLQEKARQYPNLDNYTYTGELSSLDKPPPVPLPENLWGEQWRFATLPAVAVVEAFAERPIPILEMPEFLLPINLGLASTVPVPGVVIYGGRQSMRLARWLQEAHPVSLNYIAGAPDGLVLEAGLVDRWIVATFEDKEVTAAAQAYQQRQQQSRGLHFLLVQPDESGMTYSGFWLLRGED
ncbi:Tab2/Atab2 family RNA-binding protein [Coleofasciculus sp. FACHB-1120]|uniref:Tab2/Atab2 family RNA-binding protein n=1 Tax=Coleofasciculus sp. FACHB-1120 TaxID=2692783 RepID=UPI0016833F82|nr:Tab2/Atab2 family RNA-binding protein [Coleofasciculus sp. FACHB-1120]MBD2742581.1 Tab2/Atab2 family RNA-binding protein [Coleofasciculus sp. FACHB-1120]